MGENSTSINYAQVKEKTKGIKSTADGLEASVKQSYTGLVELWKSSKGDYASAMEELLRKEKSDAVAAAEFLEALQKMINKIAKAYDNTDKSYKGKKIKS